MEDLIERKCKMMGKCSDKGRAYHLAQWMKGELHSEADSQPWTEPEIETWSTEELRQKTETLDINLNHESASAITEIDVNDNHSTSNEYVPLTSSVSMGDVLKKKKTRKIYQLPA